MEKYFEILNNKSKFSVAFLVVLSGFYFIGLGHVHLFDWDEINFAESAREMIMSGNYTMVQINYEPFWEKPPLFFWLQVLSMKVFGINEFAARFPNAIFGTIYLVTLYSIGKKHISSSFGLLWAIVYFGAILPHMYFKSGIIDPVFNYFIFMSMYFLLLDIEDNKNLNKFAILSGVFSALSVLTKGPVGFLLLVLCFVVFMIIKRFKYFPPLRSFLLFLMGFLLIVGSWVGMELYQNGTENLLKFIEYQIELFSTSVAGHEQPFYYHFVVVFLGCFPMSIFALPALFQRTDGNKTNFQLWMQILFWVVILLFSLSTTKIVHYSSMTYIPLSFLATLYIQGVVKNQDKRKKYIIPLFVIVGMVWGILFVGTPILLKNASLLFPYIHDDFAIDSLKTSVGWSGYEGLIGVVFLGCLVYSVYCMSKKHYIRSVFISGVGIGITLLLTSYFILPKIEAFTQGPVIAFYQNISHEDAYINSFGYKSYAQYFYANQKPGNNEKLQDREYLLNGPIDKSVYFVTKSTNRELDNHPNFMLLKAVGGFRFYKREVGD